MTLEEDVRSIREQVLKLAESQRACLLALQRMNEQNNTFRNEMLNVVQKLSEKIGTGSGAVDEQRAATATATAVADDEFDDSVFDTFAANAGPSTEEEVQVNGSNTDEAALPLHIGTSTTKNISRPEQTSCLLSLPTEVQEMILQYVEAGDRDPDESEEDDRIITSWREDTNPVTESMPETQDLINLSWTCVWFNRLVSPRRFKVLYLRNTKKSCRSVRTISRSKYAEYVRVLHFVSVSRGRDFMLPRDDEAYPEEYESILSNLSVFPNLQHLSVEFPFHNDRFTEITQQPFVDDSRRSALEMEDEQTDRAMMASVYNIIATGALAHPGSVKSFEIRHFPIFNVSTLYDDEIKMFLAQLTTFKFSMMEGWHDDQGRLLNTVESFWDFMQWVEAWFFEHLMSTTKLSIVGGNSGYLGTHAFEPSTRLPITTCHTPSLRHLSIKNVFIGPELYSHITKCSRTLETLELHDCYASNPNYPPHDWSEPTSWDQFFTFILEDVQEDGNSGAGPLALTSLNITFHRPGEDFIGTSSYDEDYEDIQLVEQARDKFNSGDYLQVLPYAQVNDATGAMSIDRQTTRDAFVEGTDEISYRRLLDLVAANVARKKQAEGQSSMEM